jgi:hypothetical protein
MVITIDLDDWTRAEKQELIDQVLQYSGLQLTMAQVSSPDFPGPLMDGPHGSAINDAAMGIQYRHTTGDLSMGVQRNSRPVEGDPTQQPGINLQELVSVSTAIHRIQREIDTSQCAYCQTPLPEELRRHCTACIEVGTFVAYCGKSCQRGHWPVHKRVCHSRAVLPEQDQTTLPEQAQTKAKKGDKP